MYVRLTPADRALGASDYEGSLYGIRTLRGLSGYYGGFDGGLGKLSLKKAVKSVSKAATTAVKVAVAPIAQATATAADAVGARGIANKVIDKTAVTKKIGAAQKKLATYGGYAADAAAVVVAGTVAAPYVASAAGHIGAVAGSAGSGILGKLKSASGLLGGLVKKGSSAVADAASTDAGAVVNAAKRAKKFLGGLVNTSPGTEQAGAAVDDVAEAENPGAGARIRGAARNALKKYANPAAGQQASADLVAALAARLQPPDAGTSTNASLVQPPAAPEPNPLQASVGGGMSFLTDNPKLLIVGAGASVLYYLHKQRKGGSRRKRR